MLNISHYDILLVRGGIQLKKEEISLKNTKAEILEALQQALEREKNANKAKSDPIKEEKTKKIEKAVEHSKANVEQNIFSQELINKFKELELAIQSEEEKLKELYDIEKELNNLTLVVNTQKDLMASFEKEKSEKTIEIEEKIKKLEAEYNQKQADLQKAYDDRARALKLEREREQEEYTYKTKRERELSNNAWEDEKKTREANLKLMEDETQKLLGEAKEKEAYLKELEVKVTNFATELEKEYNRGKKEATTELEKEHKYSIELLKKDYQSTIDRNEDKIKSLEAELEKERAANMSLQEKMDKAYIELKELATKTVETSGIVKIVGNTPNNDN